MSCRSPGSSVISKQSSCAVAISIVDGFLLRRRELGHVGRHLRRLDEGQRIVRGEFAVAHAEDRQRVGRLLARAFAVLDRAFLAEAAAPIVGEQRVEQIWTFGENRVVDRGRGGERADAALLRLAHAQQADHVGAVGVEAQPAVGQGAGVGGKERSALLVFGLAVGAADVGAFVADGAHQLAAAVLEDRRAEMRAEAPVHRAAGPPRCGWRPGSPSAS